MTDPKSDFEQQLQAIHPRAPELDWDRILPVSPKPMVPTGFSTWQMTSAVFASWIVGAIVGGSFIFWSMGKRSLSTDPSSETTTLVQQSKEPALELQPSQQRPSQQRPASQSPAIDNRDMHPVLAHASIDWLKEDVLSVRSHARSGAGVKLTVSKISSGIPRGDGLQNNFTDQLISDADSKPPVTIPDTAPVRNRQQLLKQVLDESQTVY